MRCFGLENFEGFPLRAVAPTHAHAHSYPHNLRCFIPKSKLNSTFDKKQTFNCRFIIRVSLSFAFVIRYSLSFFLLFRIHIHHSHLSFILIHLSSSNIVSNSHSSQFSTLSRIDTRTYLRTRSAPRIHHRHSNICSNSHRLLNPTAYPRPPRTPHHPARTDLTSPPNLRRLKP